MSKLDLKKIIQVPLSTKEFFQETTTKKQIYLHHTAGGSNAKNVINGWNKDNSRIGTCVVIDDKGVIHQTFSSKQWAYHLGIKQSVFTSNKVTPINLDKQSIGIEICNWGQLTLRNGKYYNYVNREVPSDEVTELSTPYKGYKYFHKYTDAQIESTRQLLEYWRDIYKIDLTFDYDQMFTVNKKALQGVNGLYSHNSVRIDKVDIYPCPRMISMLKSL